MTFRVMLGVILIGMVTRASHGQVSITDLYQISQQLESQYLRTNQLPMPVEIRILAHSERSWGRAAIFPEQVWTPWGPRAVFHIFVHPARLMDTSRNTWAFWLGHELGHPLIPATGGSPQAEFLCDEFGAWLAIPTGANLEAYINEYRRRPEIFVCSPTHGCEMDRLKNLIIKSGQPNLLNLLPARHPGSGMPGRWPH